MFFLSQLNCDRNFFPRSSQVRSFSYDFPEISLRSFVNRALGLGGLDSRSPCQTFRLGVRVRYYFCFDLKAKFPFWPPDSRTKYWSSVSMVRCCRLVSHRRRHRGHGGGVVLRLVVDSSSFMLRFHSNDVYDGTGFTAVYQFHSRRRRPPGTAWRLHEISVNQPASK